MAESKTGTGNGAGRERRRRAAQREAVREVGIVSPVRQYARRDKQSDPFEGDPPTESKRTYFTKQFDNTVLVHDGIVRGKYRRYGISEEEPAAEWFRCFFYHEYSEHSQTTWQAVGEEKARESLLTVLEKTLEAAQD